MSEPPIGVPLPTEPTPESPRRASVLVVDPLPLSLIATAGVLHADSMACVCARDAASALRAIELGVQDLVVWDIADDASETLASLEKLRAQPGHSHVPAILLADAKWAGLEKKVEKLAVATRCLFKPIDHHVLKAVVHELLWMPQLQSAHRRRGTRPSRPGWITL